MNKMNIPAACVLLAGVVLMSGCGKQADNNTAATQPSTTEQQGTSSATESSTPSSTTSGEQKETTPEQTDHNESSATSDQSASSDDILMIIDQSQMPTTIGGLTYWIQKLPQGYTMTGMRWDGKGKPIISTPEQSLENERKSAEGKDPGDGFYAGGTAGNHSFIYANSRRGEKGTLSFTFTNDEGKQLTWKKEITLQ